MIAYDPGRLLTRAALSIAVIGLHWLCNCQPARAEIDWKPPRTWVFAVGLLEWQHSDLYPPFPDDQPNRCDRRLVQRFKIAGVPAERIVYLEDRQGTKERIERELLAQLAKSQPGDMFVFYFAGHGTRDTKTHQTYFANYDAGETWASHWAVSSIFDVLDRHFRGDRVIMMADCCHSGALYDEAQRRKSKLSFACLTSAYSHNSSTGAWTFTDALVKGWSGDAMVDANGDGQVALKELARYAELDMAFFEQQKSMFLLTGDFDPNMRLAETKGTHAPGTGRRVEVQWKQKWWPAQVIALDGDRSKIHYAGFDATWDEWVTPDRLRAYRPQTLPVGTRVSVLWSGDNKRYPAVVVASSNGLHKVHYDGYSSQWDEWVGIKSIRKLQP
ncbi:MAG TPA: Tudor-knot domain-containing protein [Pirellulales bacterium]|jgi:hypothetical protein|nr:Tudor-knot domain-containing protein [Pirellulales bacterium]